MGINLRLKKNRCFCSGTTVQDVMCGEVILPPQETKDDIMAPKLIPIKLILDENDVVSFMSKSKRKASDIWLANSIVRDGLLNPLVVRQHGSKFIVVDGKKRLAILRRLSKLKRLSKAILKVPCIVQEVASLKPVERRRPLLLTGPELAHKIILEAQNATSPVSIAQRYECDLSVVEDCLSLPGLHPEMLKYFNNRAISLEQAAAFATIENKKAQLDLLHQLGPFVSNADIITAIREGATVVELSDDNIIFLPSRRRPEPADQEQLFEFDKRKTSTAAPGGRLVA